jgi:hypothetical protein
VARRDEGRVPAKPVWYLVPPAPTTCGDSARRPPPGHTQMLEQLYGVKCCAVIGVDHGGRRDAERTGLAASRPRCAPVLASAIGRSREAEGEGFDPSIGVAAATGFETVPSGSSRTRSRSRLTASASTVTTLTPALDDEQQASASVRSRVAPASVEKQQRHLVYRVPCAGASRCWCSRRSRRCRFGMRRDRGRARAIRFRTRR